MTKFKADLLIIVPLQEEFRFFSENSFSIVEDYEEDGITFYKVKFSQTDLQCYSLMLGDMGPSNASQLTEKILNHISPSLILLLGIAGGIDPNVKIGDIVIPNEICEFLHNSSAESKGKGFKLVFSGQNRKTSFKIINLLQNFEFKKKTFFNKFHQDLEHDLKHLDIGNLKSLMNEIPKIHIGNIASGPIVGKSTNFKDTLLSLDRKLLAIEMESAGVFRAASSRANPIDVITIRGISDFMDEDKKQIELEHSNKNRIIALHSVSNFLKSIISSSILKPFLNGKGDSLNITVRSLKIYKNYAYELIYNIFIRNLKNFIKEEILLPNFGNNWANNLPQNIHQLFQMNHKKKIYSIDIDEFFSIIEFDLLKELFIDDKFYEYGKPFFGEIPKMEIYNTLYEINRYAKIILSYQLIFTILNFQDIIKKIQSITKGNSDLSSEIIEAIFNEEYTKAEEILSFDNRIECIHNLPPKDYENDGGFVGRSKEITVIKKKIFSKQDRIITITGAGGAGKTAIALEIAYQFLEDPTCNNEFYSILWFSAKQNKLSDEGISIIEPQIKDYEKFLKDMLKIADNNSYQTFKSEKLPIEDYKQYLYTIFSSRRSLIIIDNLETIYYDEDIIDFIKDIPNNSQVIITSRKGLGEIERRIQIGDMDVNDAVKLFKLFAISRTRLDLSNLDDKSIRTLVLGVKCYPLLIKWSIGQICLGKDLESSFKLIFSGESEIAKFSFNDIFALLSEKSKIILYSFAIYPEEYLTKHVIKHLSNLSEEEFDESIKELIICSLVFSEIATKSGNPKTFFYILTLTRGFIEFNLNKNEKIRINLMTRYHHLSEKLEVLDQSIENIRETYFKLGIATPEDKIAVSYIKAAKINLQRHRLKEAKKNFEEAYKISPNISYVAVEYSKFLYHQNIALSLKIAKEATESESGKKNFHTWLNYGNLLKKAKRLKESINIFNNAKDMNSSYLPIYTQLGSIYTEMNKYAEAEKEFKLALTEEKHPNYRHMCETYEESAKNNFLWSQELKMNLDFENRIRKINTALLEIRNALKIKSTHSMVEFKRRIYLEKGMAYFKRDFNQSYSSFMKVFEIYYYKRFKSFASNEITSKGYYSLAKLYIEWKKDEKLIRGFIKKGLASSSKSSETHNDLMKLKKITRKKRLYGKIRFFNEGKKFGLINKGADQYIFFPSNFEEEIELEEISGIKGEFVSFLQKKNERKPDLPIAYQIRFEKRVEDEEIENIEDPLRGRWGKYVDSQ